MLGMSVNTSLLNHVLFVLRYFARSCAFCAHLLVWLRTIVLVCLGDWRAYVFTCLSCLRFFLIGSFICVLLKAKILVWQLKNSCLYT